MRCRPAGALGVVRFHQGVVTIFMAYLAVVQMRLQSCFLWERFHGFSPLLLWCASLAKLFRYFVIWMRVLPCREVPCSRVHFSMMELLPKLPKIPSAIVLSRIYSPGEVFDGEKLSVFFKSQFFKVVFIIALKAISTNNLCIPWFLFCFSCFKHVWTEGSACAL